MNRALFKGIVRFISTVVSVILISFLISCSADLGKFEKMDSYEDYYEAFGDVLGIYDDNKVAEEKSYNVKKSLFNEKIVNDLTWENDDDKVLFLEYCYIVIPFKAELKIESLALFARRDNGTSEENVMLEFSAFYYKDSSLVPTNIKLLTSDDTHIVEKDDGNGNTIEVEEEIEYDDPKKEDRISSAYLRATNSFDGFILENFRQTGEGENYVKDNCLCVEDGSFLYIRIENNSGLNKETMKPCAFSFLNLLVRAI